MADTPLLLLTRPPDGATAVAQGLAARGVAFKAVYSPALRVVYDAPKLPAAKGLILTSANGARAWRKMGGPSLPVFAVGDATAKAAQGVGPVWSAQGDAEDLIAGVIEQAPASPLVHLRGAHSRGNVAARLTRAGIPTQDVVGYHQLAQVPTAEALEILQGGRPVVLPLYSPRSAKIVGAWPSKAPLLVAAMSEAVSNACESAHIEQLKVATRPDSQSMLDAIAELLGNAVALETKAL